MFSGAVNDLEADHKQFVFELQVEPEDKERFIAYLKEQNLQYGSTGEYLQVSIDKSGTSNDFLNSLIKENFTVKYYRNISKSTKRLFNQ